MEGVLTAAILTEPLLVRCLDCEARGRERGGIAELCRTSERPSNEADGPFSAICLAGAVVFDDGGVAWDVKQIKGGFAAMISTSASNPRGIETSYDGGKTWQPNNAGNKVVIDSIWRTWNDRPLVKAYMTSIIQVGENFVCVHNDGIFRSSDKGKTWKFLLPSIDGKVFNLFVSGNVIYAIPSKGGC